MAEPWDGLKATFPDNTDGLITAETMRDQVDVLETEDGLKVSEAELPTQVDTHLQSGDVTQIKIGGTDVPGDTVLTQDEIDALVTAIVESGGYTQWLGNWSAGEYLENQMVLDEGWLMIANKITSDTAAPIPVGDPYYVYQGTNMVNQQATSVKQIVFGTRYTSANPFFLNKYRIKVVAGNEYEIIAVIDPLGAASTQFLNSFTADTTGWREFGIISEIHPANTAFDLMAIVNQPDPAPTSFSGPWTYSTPNNPTAPTTGVVLQANNNTALMYVHSRDNITTDRTVELQGLEVGDQINMGGEEWSIQSSTELGVDPNNYFVFGVAPAAQSLSTGSQTFTFETTTPVDITYGREDNYYLTEPTQGLYAEDDSWENVVANDNAYGCDIEVQAAYVSPDWDVMATSDVGRGGTTTKFAYHYTKVLDFVVTDDTYEDVAELILPDQANGVYEYAMSWAWNIDTITRSAYFRFSVNGGSSWDEIVGEAKDVSDSQYRYYAFPLDWPEEGTRQLLFQAKKDAGGTGDVLNIPYCDVIIKKVGETAA